MRMRKKMSLNVEQEQVMARCKRRQKGLDSCPGSACPGGLEQFRKHDALPLGAALIGTGKGSFQMHRGV